MQKNSSQFVSELFTSSKDTNIHIAPNKQHDPYHAQETITIRLEIVIAGYSRGM